MGQKLENIDLEGIKAVLPHREPFLLIDRVVSCDVGERCVAEWHLTGDEYFFAGHFPEKPVTPGVLLLESLAQAGGFAVLSQDGMAGSIVLFAKADKVKFRRQVLPGDTLQLEIEMSRLSKIGGTGMGKATVDGEVACQAEITFVFAR